MNREVIGSGDCTDRLYALLPAAGLFRLPPHVAPGHWRREGSAIIRSGHNDSASIFHLRCPLQSVKGRSGVIPGCQDKIEKCTFQPAS
nr:MAG TPA_asm: hypothetical protein [Caudoviricetes sp.]